MLQLLKKACAMLALVLTMWSNGAACTTSSPDATQRPFLRIELGSHSGEITQLAVAPQTSRLFTVSVDKTLRVWKMPMMALEHTLRIPIGDGFEGLACLERIVPEMRAGEVVDQHRIRVCGDRANDDFGFHAAFADRECGGGGNCGFMIGICI